MRILGYGSMINATRSASVLALLNFFALLFYFNHTGDIPGWVMGVFVLFLTIILGLLIKSTFAGGSD